MADCHQTPRRCTQTSRPMFQRRPCCLKEKPLLEGMLERDFQ